MVQLWPQRPTRIALHGRWGPDSILIQHIVNTNYTFLESLDPTSMLTILNRWSLYALEPAADHTKMMLFNTCWPDPCGHSINPLHDNDYLWTGHNKNKNNCYNNIQDGSKLVLTGWFQTRAYSSDQLFNTEHKDNQHLVTWLLKLVC